MFSSASFTVLLVAALSMQTLAAPLTAKIGSDGSQANRHAIENAMPVANQKIKNMQAVIGSSNAKSHPAVRKAFGNDANVGKIRKTVDKLANGRIVVPHTDSASGVTEGATNPRNGHVTFGSTFYQSGKSANSRAGTIIHEASHALGKTVDAFDRNGKPYKYGESLPSDKVRAGVQIGYKDSNMDSLKASSSKKMHHNADSYRVFAEECPEAREDLFERAMLEDDVEIREFLFRRACKPGAKGSKAPAGKAAPKPAAAKPAAVKAGRK
ncbi:unnamed protein product [Cyclocybe aegerita]|uniref:Lysine-specific metallo-endopeptidase domain-containing protein n=1 Tax=Cyclocybe aegerita TaxID=1973307 RepID=A0A8S0VVG3_CYCAE|nr:unnamed protein product [Cyclocybe aegerita]